MHNDKDTRNLTGIRRTLSLFVPGLTAAYDYDSHMLRRALAYGCGAFVMLMAFCAQALCTLLPATEGSDAEAVAEWMDHIVGLLTKEFVDGTFASSHIVSTIAMFVLLGIGVAIFIATAKDHDAFIEAYPEVEDPYKPEHAKQASRFDWIVAGIGAAVMLCGASLVLWHLFGLRKGASVIMSTMVDALGFFLLAAGAFAFISGRLAARRFNVFAYNYAALAKKSPYEIHEEKAGPERDIALREKALQDVGRWVAGIVWGAAVVLAFVLFALPSIHTPLWWIPLVVAAVALHFYGHHNEKRARKLYRDHQNIAGN